jgi:hypothetical protein
MPLPYAYKHASMALSTCLYGMSATLIAVCCSLYNITFGGLTFAIDARWVLPYSGAQECS